MKSIFKSVLLVLVFVASAQQMTPLSNFMYNQQVYNPAAFGTGTSRLNFATLTRMQWITIDGAPLQGNFWGDYKFKNMAAGLNMSAIGYSGYSTTDLNLNYAYRISLNRKLTLSSGMRLGFVTNRFSSEDFNIWDQEDQVIQQSNFQKSSLRIGAGFHLSGKRFYLGVSSPDFVTDKVSIEGDTAASFMKYSRNIVVLSGLKIRLSDEYNIRPHIGFFYYPRTGLAMQLNTTFEIKDYFWIGLSASSYQSASLLLGTHISSRIRFGYAFETQALFGTNLNSHELNLMLTLDNLFRKKKD